MNINLEVDGDVMGRLAESVPALFEKSVGLLGSQVEGDAKRIVGGKILSGQKLKAEVTGNLGGSIGMQLQGSGDQRIAEIYATAKYAEYVHEGTGVFGPLKRPIIIKAKHAKALAFTFKGNSIFARSVRIMGMRPRPFLRIAAERNMESDRLRRIIEKAGKACGIEITS